MLCFFFHDVHAQFHPTPPLPNNIAEALIGDSNYAVTVSEIVLTGNKRTKKYIIERELILKLNDTVLLKDLHETIDQSRRLVYNTTLFISVDITPVLLENQQMSLVVQVKEKWYIYPLPHLELSDRNFNEWWNTYNADFSRLIYGARFTHFNTSGRRDKLTVTLLSGYKRNISVEYSAPYSNSNLTEGFSLVASYSEQKETNINTSFNNKIELYKTEDFSTKEFKAGGSYMMRRGYYHRHQFSLYLNYISVSDSVIILNPFYFNKDQSDVFFPEVSYKLDYTNVDNTAYSLDGEIYSAKITKRGVGFSGGINSTTLEVSGKKHIPHRNKWYSSFQIDGQIKVPFNLAYINRQALGYKEFYLRGLEYYTINAPVAILGKYTLKKKVIAFNIGVPFKNVIADKIPFQIFAKTYGDIGYAYTHKAHTSSLNNKWLYSSGFGIDILSLYDMSLGIEYSFNQLGENGLFLHITNAF